MDWAGHFANWRRAEQSRAAVSRLQLDELYTDDHGDWRSPNLTAASSRPNFRGLHRPISKEVDHDGSRYLSRGIGAHHPTALCRERADLAARLYRRLYHGGGGDGV